MGFVAWKTTVLRYVSHAPGGVRKEGLPRTACNFHVLIKGSATLPVAEGAKQHAGQHASFRSCGLAPCVRLGWGVLGALAVGNEACLSYPVSPTVDWRQGA